MLTSVPTRNNGAVAPASASIALLQGGGGECRRAAVEVVRMVPAGSATPEGWRVVVVAAEADAAGEHRPAWELQFDPSVVGQLIRGGPINEPLRQHLANDDWEEVLAERPEGAPQTGSYYVQRVDGLHHMERSKRLHPSRLPPSSDIGL